jgi:transposase-like protein
MSRRWRAYTIDEKITALRVLEANRGNLSVTSQQTGIPRGTLRGWRRQFGIKTEMPVDLEQLRQRLIAEALELASHIHQAIHEAPLNHRAAALNQMLDKIFKLTELLEEEKADELQEANTPVLRIEYVDEYGQVHATPPEAAGDLS